MTPQNKQSDIHVNSITREQASCFFFFPTRIETSGMQKYLATVPTSSQLKVLFIILPINQTNELISQKLKNSQ